MIRSADPADFRPDDARFFEAVRYLLDEMSPPEVERFEDELAVDQSLREILAEAVLVTHAAYAAHLPLDESAERPAEASPHGAAPRQDHSLFGMLLALAAMLLLAATGSFLWVGLGGNPSDIAGDDSHEQVQLASAWVERLENQSQENTTLWDDDLLAASSLDVSSESDDDELLLEGSSVDPPAWMLKALAAQQEDDLASPAM